MRGQRNWTRSKTMWGEKEKEKEVRETEERSESERRKTKWHSQPGEIWS